MFSNRTIFITLLFLSFGISSYAQEGEQTLKESFNQVKSVLLKGSFCNIEVEGIAGDKAEVFAEIKGSGADRFRIEHQFQNGELEIWVTNQKKNFWGGNLKGMITVKVPKAVALEIDNSSGNVLVKNLEGGEKLVLGASSGNVEASDIHRDLTATTSSGNIELSKVTGHVKVRSSSGNQHLADIGGGVKSIASSGNVRIAHTQGMVDVYTSSGDVTLNDTAGGLKLKTSSGDVKGTEVLLKENADVKTTSGSVKIDFSNALSEMSFELTASSGSLRVGGDKSDRKLLLKQGGVLVRGVSSSGNQTYE